MSKVDIRAGGEEDVIPLDPDAFQANDTRIPQLQFYFSYHTLWKGYEPLDFSFEIPHEIATRTWRVGIIFTLGGDKCCQQLEFIY